MAKSKWVQDRAKKLAKMKWPKTQRTWLARWRRNLHALREKVTDLWTDRRLYTEYRQIVLSNPSLDKRAGFFHLVDHMYLSHVLIAIRTFDDTNPKSLSLYNLIEEIRDNASQVDRAWFVNRYRKRSMGEQQFKDHWGGKAHIDKRRVDADLRSLVAMCRRIRVTANKYLAHNARRKPVKPATYGEVEAAIDGIFALVSRYHALLFGSAWGTPSILSSARIFEVPWRAK